MTRYLDWWIGKRNKFDKPLEAEFMVNSNNPKLIKTSQNRIRQNRRQNKR